MVSLISSKSTSGRKHQRTPAAFIKAQAGVHVVASAVLGSAAEEWPSTRLRAFIASVRPLQGSSYEDDQTFWEALGLIHELALAYDLDKDVEWAPSQCAAVLYFLQNIEPLEGRCYCTDTLVTGVSIA